MSKLSPQEHRSVAQKPPLLLVFSVLLGTSLIAFHDLSFPLLMLDPTGDFSQNMAEAVTEGNVLRQICLPVIGGLGVYLLYRPRSRRMRLDTILGIILLTYVVWVALSFTWAEDPSLSLRRVIVFICLFVGAVGLASLDTRSIQLIFIGIILATFCIGLLNELALGTFAPWRADYRFAGTVHPNMQAASMGQLALTGLCIILDPNVRRRWIGPALLVTGLAAVMMTGSRTSLIAFAAAATLVAFLWARRNARRSFVFGVSTLVTIGCLELVTRLADPEASPINSALGLLERPRDEGNIAALTGRTDVWDTCIRMAMDHPLTGYGFESFWTPVRILEISSIHQWSVNQAHSVYIEHLVSLGFVGLGLWCVLILGSLGVALRKYAIDRSSTTLWLTGLVAFCIVHGFNESINMLPVFNGYLLIVVIAHLVLYRKPRSIAASRGACRSHAAHIAAPRVVA